MAFTKITASGIDTAGTVTTESISVSGVSTIGSLSIGSTQVISSAFQLQNIASLDATTTATIETAIQQAPNNFTSLNISGISTLQSTTLIGGGTSTGTASQPLQVTGGAYVSGNLGIGATNPIGFGTAKAVIARAFGKGSGVGLWVEAGDNTGSIKDNVALVLNDSSSGSSGGNSLIFRQTNPGSPRRYAGIWGVTNLSGSGGNLVFGTIDSDNDTTGPIGRAQIDGFGNLLIANNTATGTASQRLQVTGGAYVSGNLGIGNSLPSSPLDIQGGQFRIRASGTYSEPTDNAGVIGYDSIGGDLTISARSSGGSTGISFRTSNSGTGAEKARITSDGKFGLGTSNPESLLHINGDATAFRVTRGSSIGFAYNTGTAATDPFRIQSNGGPVDLFSAAGHPITFSAGTTEKARIDGSGNFGLGKTPIAKFDIGLTGTTNIATTTITKVTDFGTSASFGFNGLSNNNDGVFFGMGAGGGNGIPAGIGFMREASGWNTALAFYTNNVTSGPNSTNAMQEKMRINSSGNLGIGVADPAYRLTISGNASFSGNQSSPAYLYANGGGDDSSLFIKAGSTAGVWSQIEVTGNWNGSANTGGKVAFYAGGTERQSMNAIGAIIKNQATREYNYSGFVANNAAITIDVPVVDDTNTAGGHKIWANHTHYNWSGYGALLECWISSRGTSIQEQYNTHNVTSGNGGAWTVTKPTTTTLRISKSAGTYTGPGYYWVRVITNHF